MIRVNLKLAVKKELIKLKLCDKPVLLQTVSLDLKRCMKNKSNICPSESHLQLFKYKTVKVPSQHRIVNVKKLSRLTHDWTTTKSFGGRN
jgi:hypothetical protein